MFGRPALKIFEASKRSKPGDEALKAFLYSFLERSFGNIRLQCCALGFPNSDFDLAKHHPVPVLSALTRTYSEQVIT